MKYRLTGFYAQVFVGTGFAVIAVALILAVLLIFLPLGLDVHVDRLVGRWGRGLIAAATVLGGVLLAAPFVVTGELILIFLDQRRLLVRIHRRLQTWEEERQADHLSVTEAPPPRRPPKTREG